MSGRPGPLHHGKSTGPERSSQNKLLGWSCSFRRHPHPLFTPHLSNSARPSHSSQWDHGNRASFFLLLTAVGHSLHTRGRPRYCVPSRDQLVQIKESSASSAFIGVTGEMPLKQTWRAGLACSSDSRSQPHEACSPEARLQKQHSRHRPRGRRGGYLGAIPLPGIQQYHRTLLSPCLTNKNVIFKLGSGDSRL